MGCQGRPQESFRLHLIIPISFQSHLSPSWFAFGFPWAPLCWQVRPQVLFRSPLPPSWFGLRSLRFAYGRLGSHPGFISVASVSLLVRFGLAWVPLCAGRVALGFESSRLCLPPDSVCDPLGSLMCCLVSPQALFGSPLPPSRLDLGSLRFPYDLLGSPPGFISIASAFLSIRFAFPWVPLWAVRVAPRFHFSRICLPLGSLWVTLGSLTCLQGRPQVSFQSPLPLS